MDKIEHLIETGKRLIEEKDNQELSDYQMWNVLDKIKEAYESPIKIMQGKYEEKIEGDVFSAVQSYGIDIDKEELIKALKADSERYEQAYKKGYAVGFEGGFQNGYENGYEHGREDISNEIKRIL